MRAKLLALLMAVSLAGCGGFERDLPPLGQITQVDVWLSLGDGSSDIWKISDPRELSQIVAFVDARRTGWRRPWYGVPVPVVTARFYDGETLKGTFGMGNKFFGTQRDGDFLSRSASAQEIRDFGGLLGVDDAKVRELTK